MAKTEITLPNGWRPRPYQRALWAALERGCRRAIAIWHRRAGKDDLCLHWAAISAVERVGTYWHMLPNASQARKAIWKAINPHSGKRRIDEAFPPAMRRRTNDQEMFIELVNGSTWQVVGSDNFNSLVGSPPLGVVFSEWALANPAAWAYLRPILAENGGWALFITTPRGRNHAAAMFQAAQNDANWFAQRLTADQTSVFAPEVLAAERAELIREYGPDDGDNLFQQEYFCSFDAAVVGAYYGKLMQRADEEGRVKPFPWEPAVPVHTLWDLGVDDSTAIWCVQLVGREVRLIDFIDGSGTGLDWYVNQLSLRPYTWGTHYLPHDAKVKELGTGKSRVETLNGLGLLRIEVVPAQSVADGINAVRQLLPRCWFNTQPPPVLGETPADAAARMERGLAALRQYRKVWDAKRKVFQDQPLHDWTSHAADALRTGATGMPDKPKGDFGRKLSYPKVGVV